MADYLRACIESVKAGGNRIADLKSTKVEEKPNEYVGRGSRVTNADYESQEKALERLFEADLRDNFYFITEEHAKNPKFRQRVISPSNLELMKNHGVYIFDELDGTPSHQSGHHEWSVSCGYVDAMKHMAGAVYAPKIGGGTTFFGSYDNGAFVQEGNREPIQVEVSKQTDLKKSQVLLGIDCATPKYPLHNQLMAQSGRRWDWGKTMGSCAVGLGLIASGRQDLLIQPLQSCWDWAGGKISVEEAGGVMIFYEMEKNDRGEFTKIKPVDILEPRHYDPTKRTLGFVAGNRSLAEDAMSMLLSLR